MTPPITCPDCGARMRPRPCRHGGEFYVCIRFPRCKGVKYRASQVDGKRVEMAGKGLKGGIE